MKTETIADLKAGLDLRALVAESYPLGRSGKILCPFHKDTHPSCHIYPDGYKCFGCGAYGDHLSWLEAVEGLSKAQAVERLKALSGVYPVFTPRRRQHKPTSPSSFSPIEREAYQGYLEAFKATRALPKALAGRGLAAGDAFELGIAALGDDALLPITGPSGTILALKTRFYQPREGQRYVYTTAGHGSPAWCSPGFSAAEDILVVEGELNGMVSYLALREVGSALAVMGVAGAYGHLHKATLTGKQVFVWGDNDASGKRAQKRWLSAARREGCQSARALGATQEDACDIAGAQGRLYLASWLLEAIHTAPAKKKRKKTRTFAWAA